MGVNDMTISSVVVPIITLGSAGKIDSVDDYHYIQIDQPNDTLTIQEYGTISWNNGHSKTQKAYISSVCMYVSGRLGVQHLSKLSSSVKRWVFRWIH